MAAKKLKEWFDKDLAELLSNKIHQVDASFLTKKYINEVDQLVGDLELKDRVELMADLLYDYLNGSYSQKVDTLMKIMGPENPNETGMFTEYYWLMPVAKMVEKYGLNDYDKSIKAIEEITKRNTGEYCIRPFLHHYPKKTLKRMMKWAKSSNLHLRRLASEGARPKLPWAKKLEIFIDDPEESMKILEPLKDDPSKFVQKSVANCLNDIGKFHPDWLLDTMKEWKKGSGSERKWIIKNALRGLVKNGNSEAIQLVDQL